MYYECVRTTSGLWELGSSMSDQDAMRIQSRVRIETENKPYPEMKQTATTAAGVAAAAPKGDAPKGDAYLKELLSRQQRGDRLSEEEAFAFYNLQVQPLCSRVLSAVKMEVVHSRFLSALRFILFGII